MARPGLGTGARFVFEVGGDWLQSCDGRVSTHLHSSVVAEDVCDIVKIALIES